MRVFLRPYFKQLLAWLSLKVIQKHQPKIVAIIGTGETSIARELIFKTLNIMHPARRNRETPEAEFSVPLTIFNYPGYPKTALEWSWVVAKTVIQILWLRPYPHFLVLELDTVNPKIQSFWLKLLNPELTVITGDNPKVKLATREIKLDGSNVPLELYKEVAVKIAAHYEIEPHLSEMILEDVKLPKGRISFLPGPNGSFIIDATHYYFPISIKSVWEMVDEDSKVVLISQNPADLEFAQSQKHEEVSINPGQVELKQNDTIILRGPRAAVLRKYKHLLPK